MIQIVVSGLLNFMFIIAQTTQKKNREQGAKFFFKKKEERTTFRMYLDYRNTKTQKILTCMNNTTNNKSQTVSQKPKKTRLKTNNFLYLNAHTRRRTIALAICFNNKK